MSDIYRCAVRFTTALGSNTAINVFHVLDDTAQAQQIATDFEVAVPAAYAALQPVDVHLQDITVTNLANMTQYTGTIGTVGEVVSDILPPEVAAVVTWRTAYVGRKYRGRTYIPFMPETFQTAGIWSGGCQTALDDWAQAILAWMAAGQNRKLVVYHREEGTHTIVVNYVVREYTKSQRRRQVGVGL